LGSDTDHLVVDAFLETVVDARALQTALDTRLIDRLAASPGVPDDVLRGELGADARGFDALVALLERSGVLERTGGEIRLSERFREALRYRDLLEAKLEFTGLVLRDFAGRFTQWVIDPAGFQRDSDLFRLFDYARCSERTRESYERTRRWVRLTTALTKYEARACLARHDFGRYRRMLDVGGNSGEFALRACREHPQLRATVLDLPVVCEIGQEHLLPEPERDRISFLARSALDGPLPAGFDLVTFKSMLHDWPEGEVRRLLAAACAALEPGGTLLVFERGPLDLRRQGLALSTLPIFLFGRSYRGPAFYGAELQALGFGEVDVQELHLDAPFFLLAGRKPAP
jgi:hypothetical protein